jgi:hypothetical protein
LGGSDLTRGVTCGGSGLTRGVTCGGSGLTRGVTCGGSGLARGVTFTLLVRPLPPKVTPLVRPDFRYTKIVKCYLIIPSQERSPVF